MQIFLKLDTTVRQPLYMLQNCFTIMDVGVTYVEKEEIHRNAVVDSVLCAPSRPASTLSVAAQSSVSSLVLALQYQACLCHKVFLYIMVIPSHNATS